MEKGWKIGRTQIRGDEKRDEEKWREDTSSRCQIWLVLDAKKTAQTRSFYLFAYDL